MFANNTHKNELGSGSQTIQVYSPNGYLKEGNVQNKGKDSINGHSDEKLHPKMKLKVALYHNYYSYF